MPCAKVGPCARSAAKLCAEASRVPGSHKRLKNPQRSASSPLMERPVYNSSAARPWPITRGNSAHAPMSQPARPTRVNRKAILLRAVPKRMSDANASMAPAPAQMPSIAATTGCGQARIALTKSPVMRVKASNPGISSLVKGPMMSCTSPPEQKFSPAPVMTTALTSSA